MQSAIDFEIDDRSYRAQWDDEADLRIASTPRAYDVRLRGGSDAWGEALARIESDPRAIAVVDERVAKLHGAGRPFPSERCLLVPADETFKSLPGMTQLLSFFEQRGVNKGSRVVVVGGGIVQDVAAFACAIYKRGTPWVFYPTTLLAQSDSCIGAKAGLNHERAKNQLGLFSSPHEVVIHSDFLRTLDLRDVRSGLGEVLKLHVTGGPLAMERYRAQLPAQLDQLDALLPLVRSALAVKRAVIEHDEFEQGPRRALNLGHTFGHALEAASDHRIAHGTAVVFGMLIVNELSTRWGLLDAEANASLASDARRLLSTEDWEHFAAAAGNGLVELLRKDKKVSGDTVTLALVERPGRIVLRPTRIDDALARDVGAAVDALVGA